MAIRISNSHWLAGGLFAIVCLLPAGLALKWPKIDAPESTDSVAGATRQPSGPRGGRAPMTMEKWNTFIADPARYSDEIPGIFRHWLVDDYNSAVSGFAALAEMDPDLAMRTCAELGSMKEELPISQILELARRTLDGDALAMLQAGIALALANRNPGDALDLFADSGVAAEDKQRPFAREMVQEIHRIAAATDPAGTLSWIQRHQSSGIQIDWRALCAGMMEHRREPIDEHVIATLVAAIPSNSASVIEDILLLSHKQPETKLNYARALLQSLPAATLRTDAQKRQTILRTLARYSPELFESGDHSYEYPQDAYAVGQGRFKTSLESGLAWANAIDSPESRDHAIRGVVHGLLEEGSHFTSERIRMMPPDEPTRSKAVMAMVEWLEARGMAREAAPWRDHLSEAGHQLD